jgi:hypothetical protein
MSLGLILIIILVIFLLGGFSGRFGGYGYGYGHGGIGVIGIIAPACQICRREGKLVSGLWSRQWPRREYPSTADLGCP